MIKADVVIIGAGASGLFTALDLVIRGASVVVVDRQGLANGTTGRFHGLLHSGARYSVRDRRAAEECARESATLSRIAKHAVFDVGSYFLAFKEDDDKYIEEFRAGLKGAGIRGDEVPVSDLLQKEPEISKDAYCAISVPDKVIDPFRLLAGVAHMAKVNGAKFHLHSSVKGISESGTVTASDGLELSGKVIVNSAGPWAGQVASLAGKDLGLMPTVGVMLVYKPRLVDVVLNHLRPPSDGDVMLPFYDANILGTTVQIVEDIDHFVVDDEDVQDLVYEGAKMIPALKSLKYSRVYCSARPLFKGPDPRGVSRDFAIVDKGRLVTVLGGKLTTCRLMGEKVSDLVSAKLGLKSSSVTATLELEDVLSRGGAFGGTIGEETYGPGANFATLEREVSS